MRIERLRVDAFGRLRGLDSGPTPLPGLVVVVGPNEAGKSTLFHFLTSMLYGFYPATREGNPHAPWDGADPSGSVSILLDAGAKVEVERRLRSQPTGHLEVQGRTEDLRNRTLPWAEHVPRAVFRQVFAVTLSEMASLDAETWARVQDRILGSMGSTDLRPAREVVAELEQEAGEIWRPTRRGNQRARLLTEEMQLLRASRREAVERDRRHREVHEELERARAELARVRHDRQEALVAVERVQALIPIRGQLRRIAALREDAGDERELAGLPADPEAALTAADEGVRTLERRLEELAREAAGPQAAARSLAPADTRLLEHADAVAAFLARSATRAVDRDRLAALEQELGDLRRRTAAAAAQVLAAPLDPSTEEAVARLPLPELREQVQRAARARDERRRAEELLFRAPPPAPPPSPAPSLALLAAGAVVSVAGWSTGSTLTLGTGAALLVLGAWLTVAARRGRGAASTPTADAGAVRAQAASASRAEEESVGRARTLLAPLPVLPSLLADPGEALVAGLERLQERLRDHAERHTTAEGLRDRREAAEADAARLADLVGRGAGLDAHALARLLEGELAQAQARARTAEEAEREVVRIARDEARARDELARALEEAARLRERLAAAGGGEPPHGLATVRERLQARDRAHQLEDELQRAHPDLDEIRTRIRVAEERGEPWTVEDDHLARRRAAVEELADRLERLVERVTELEKDLEALRRGATVDAVDGAIGALEEEERALLADRDRRWLMAQLLREADRRFREEHQPDVLRRAGEHLRFLTGGRYDRLAVDETAPDGGFHLLGPRLPGPVPLAPPVSTGTLEQAYLALRLAIVDHLDQGLERLPLFVDEVFVNWDAPRRRQGLALVQAIAERRQVFVFTCHGAIAESLRSLGAAVLTLDPAS